MSKFLRSFATMVLVLSLLGVFTSITEGAVTITVNGAGGADYTTIQEALDAAVSGDTISVAAGAYIEDIEIPEYKHNLEIVGAGLATTTIKGIDTSGGPNIKIHTTNGIKIHGFRIESPDIPDGAGAGGIIFSGENIEIYDNKCVSNFGAANTYAIAMQSWRSQWVGDPWFLWKEHDISGLNIHDNVFESIGASDSGYYGVYLNRDSGSGTATISANTFSGTVRYGAVAERSNLLIQNNVFNDPTGIRGGIVLVDFGDANTNDPEYAVASGGPRLQDNIQITRNTVKGFSNATYAGVLVGWPSQVQTFTNIVVDENIIQNNSNGVMVVSSANGVVVKNNNISSNTVSINNSDLDANTLNASANHLGSLDETVVFGTIVNPNTVDFTPLLSSTDADPGTAGFQPDLSPSASVKVHSLGQQVGDPDRIKEIISLAPSS